VVENIEGPIAPGISRLVSENHYPTWITVRKHGDCSAV